jgi:hypothetical protein
MAARPVGTVATLARFGFKPISAEEGALQRQRRFEKDKEIERANAEKRAAAAAANPPPAKRPVGRPRNTPRLVPVMLPVGSVPAGSEAPAAAATEAEQDEEPNCDVGRDNGCSSARRVREPRLAVQQT